MAVGAVVLFLLLMIGIGWWGKTRTTSVNDYFLGGRNIGPWVSAFAYGTTYFSAVLFIDFAGKLGWGFGLPVMWIALGNAVVGSGLAWLCLGARTRRMSHNLNAMTMPEFFEARYGDAALKYIAAVVVFVFLTPYSASVYKGLSYLFEQGWHVSFDAALITMTVVTGIYLVLGGYFAVAMADTIQGVIMIFGAIAMVGVLVGHGGGFNTVLSEIAIKHAQHVPAAKAPSALMLFSLVFMTSFGPWGMPQMVQKFYAVRDESVIKKAALVTTIFAMIIAGAAYFTGAMTHIFVDKLPLLPTGKPAFDRVIPELLGRNLPEPLMALILLLVLSASMSTLASLVLVSASAVTIDFFQGLRPDLPKAKALSSIRWLSVVFVAISYVIAKYDFSVIVTLMALSWGAVAGAFTAPFIYGLFWKRVTRAAAYAGMFSGIVTMVVLFALKGPDWSPIASMIAILVPFGVVPAVTSISKPPRPAVIEQAFEGPHEHVAEA